MKNTIYKIKDSVDLFLNNEKYLTTYFINTRQRQTFKVNQEMIALIQIIDGVNTIDDICNIMFTQYNVSNESVMNIMTLLTNKKIITEVSCFDELISKDDFERYNRQINYFSEFLSSEKDGVLAQIKLFNSHVGIFGCGAVGGNIAMQLVMTGVRNITLFDMDTISIADKSRHMYYNNKNTKTVKVDSLKDELLKIDGKTKITCVHKSMKPTDNIEPLIRNLDFVVNTLDEPYIGYTASKISRVCIKYNIPHFVAGGFDAHLASTGELIIPYVTPCVECYAEHFKVSLANWKPKKHPVKNSDMEIGGLSSMTLFSSSFAAIEIIKYLAGLTDMNNSFKIRGELLFRDLDITYLEVKKNPDCLVCGGKAYYET